MIVVTVVVIVVVLVLFLLLLLLLLFCFWFSPGIGRDERKLTLSPSNPSVGKIKIHPVLNK
jgi:hypothetical protein